MERSNSLRRAAVLGQHLGHLNFDSQQRTLIPQNTSADGTLHFIPDRPPTLIINILLITVVRELIVRGGSNGKKQAMDVRSLKDFVGKEVGTSPWLKITQQRVNAFAVTTHFYT